MKPTEYAVAALLAGVVMGLALFYGTRQVLVLRRVVEAPAADERAYVRRQAWLRLLGCLLMLTLGALLAGAYAGGLERRAVELGQFIEAQQAAQIEPLLDANQQAFREFYRGYWLGILLLLLCILALALADLCNIRRFRRQQLAKLGADRRAMLRDELARLRQERNGHASPAADDNH